MNDQDFLSITEAATQKRVSTHEIRRGIMSGDLPAIQKGDAHFVRRDQLDAWVPHEKAAAGADYTAEEANEEFHTPSVPS
jgi:hypothetical protein